MSAPEIGQRACHKGEMTFFATKKRRIHNSGEYLDSAFSSKRVLNTIRKISSLASSFSIEYPIYRYLLVII